MLLVLFFCCFFCSNAKRRKIRNDQFAIITCWILNTSAALFFFTHLWIWPPTPHWRSQRCLRWGWTCGTGSERWPPARGWSLSSETTNSLGYSFSTNISFQFPCVCLNIHSLLSLSGASDTHNISAHWAILIKTASALLNAVEVTVVWDFCYNCAIQWPITSERFLNFFNASFQIVRVFWEMQIHLWSFTASIFQLSTVIPTQVESLVIQYNNKSLKWFFPLFMTLQ